MTATITAAELTAMRTVEEEALPGTAVIYQRSGSADGMGGITETWTAASTVDARLTEMPINQREAVIGNQIVTFSKWDIVMPWDSVITSTDRILYTPGSRMFEVTFVHNDRAWPTSLRAEVVAVNEEAARE